MAWFGNLAGVGELSVEDRAMIRDEIQQLRSKQSNTTMAVNAGTLLTLAVIGGIAYYVYTDIIMGRSI